MLKRNADMRLNFLLFIGLALTVMSSAWAADYHRSDRVDRMIIKYKESSGQKSQASPERAIVQHTRGTLHSAKRKTGDNADIYFLDKPRSASEARQIAQELMQRADVEYAEPDYRRYPAFIPNDPDYTTDQWYLKLSTVEPGAINAQQAWEVTRGDASVVVAVIDTGILQHEDIANGRVLAGYDFISDSDSANDGNGRDSDPEDAGDFVTNAESNASGGPFEDCDVSNSSWHGTLVSGLIIAETGNLQGIAGLDHHAMLLPVRVLGKCGGSSSDIADAIRWAAGLPVPGAPVNDNPADVINLSLGGPDSCDMTEQTAIDAAVAAGTVVVAAAGNEGQIGIDAPASCNNVIAVAATTRDGAETCYTNVSGHASGDLDHVDLSAPGGNDSAGPCDGVTPNDLILSTGNNGTTTASSDAYEYVMGTSFATPLVSGVAALMRAVDGGLTPTSIEMILKNTARTFPNGTNDGFQDCISSRCGAGILDAFGAVTAAGNGGLDSVPNPFTLHDRENAELGTRYISNSVKVTGIDTDAVVKISGDGEYSIDGGSFTDANGTITANQRIRVRLRSAGTHSTRLNTRLTIGGISDTFVVTTKGKSGGGGGEAAWLLPLLIAWRLRKRKLTISVQ
jgi:serine protease